MLRDAIRILCQNTVSHNSKLAIEALVGITIDDGDESIIVSISETVGAMDCKTEHTDAQYQNAEAGYPNYNPQETFTEDDNKYNSIMSYSQQYNPSLPYHAVVKKETSVITYNGFPPNDMSASHVANQYVAPDGSYSGYSTADYGYHETSNAPHGRKVTASRPQRGRGRGQGVQCAPRQKMTDARKMAVPKQDIGGEVDTMTTGEVDSNEVSCATMYTCQRCGKQMSLYSSFLRHRKTHLGIVYRCDGCGKACTRKDALKAHQRNCEAAQRQAALKQFL